VIEHELTALPVCPTCGHMLTDDEIHSSGVDVWALAPDEGRDELDCPACDQHYYIHGGYRPQYTTAIDEDEL
jgi:uncharacterized protein YbaR (Trm112 family)